VEDDVAQNLAGRTAVITGASSGIGEATARVLAAEGAAVALLARRTERIEALAAEITAAGGKAVACVADVQDRDAVRRAADTVGEALGPVHILINNAGVMLLSRFAAGKCEEWRTMIDTNLTGALLVSDAFLPQLIAAQGDIVNISSVSGRTTAPNFSVYNATKWGLTAWSDALRKELVKAGVRVIVVEPGVVATELAEHISDERIRTGVQEFHDTVGALQAEDVAETIVFALSQPHRVSLNEILIRPTGQAG
jgi:NADP-dependent 3-hydroxy acid dehydrogenase YdfG